MSAAGAPPRNLTWGLLLAASLVAAAWMWAARASGYGWADDIPYAHMPLPGGDDDDFFAACGERITSFTQLPAAAWRHYVAVNGRLANSLAFCFTLLPSWLLAAWSGAGFLVMALSAARLALGEQWRSRPLAVALLLWSIWVFLPWDNFFSSLDFYSNYVGSAALNMAFVSLLLRPSRHVPAWMLFLLAPVAAMMHEGFGATLDALLLLLLLLQRFRERSTLALALLYMAFSIVPLLSPGIWSRTEEVAGMGYAYNFFSYTLGLSLLPFWGMLLLWAGVSLWRRRLSRDGALLWVAALVGIGVCVMARIGARATFWPLLLAITATATLVPYRREGRVSMWAAGAFGLLMLAWGAWLASWQYALSMELKRAISLARHTQTPVMDFTRPGDLPWSLLHMVHALPCEAIHLANISAETRRSSQPEVFLLPPGWENAPLLKGDAGARGDGDYVIMERPVPMLIYRHDLRGEKGVGASPLYRLKLHGRAMKEETVDIFYAPMSDGRWAGHPLRRARSLEPCRVVRVDTLPDWPKYVN